MVQAKGRKMGISPTYNYETVTVELPSPSGHRSENAGLDRSLVAVTALAHKDLIRKAMKELTVLPSGAWDSIRSQLFDTFIFESELTGDDRILYENLMRQHEDESPIMIKE